MSVPQPATVNSACHFNHSSGKLFGGLVLVITVTLAGFSQADGIGFQRYYDQNEFALTAPGAQKFGLYGYDNPAQLHFLSSPDLTLNWVSDNVWYDEQRWNATIAGPGAGFTFNRDRRTGQRVDNYSLAFGGGTDDAAAGLGIGWYRGDTDSQDLRTYYTLGTLSRPSENFSMGLTGRLAGGVDYYEVATDVAYRPTGSPRLAVFGDYVWGNADSSDRYGDWSAGASSEVLSGVQVAGRYFDGGTITAGLQFSLGRSSVGYQSHLPDSGNGYNSYSVRTGAFERNVFSDYLSTSDSYMNLDLGGQIAYQRFNRFDRRKSLLGKLDQIDKATRDDNIAGIVVNTTNMQVSPSMGWEIQAALNDFRDSGKHVVLYIENGGMTELHMTAAADTVVMDPSGTLFVPGLVSGTTYLADLFEQLGIGVDELREMDYKSALESLARSDMSDADREQRQALIDGLYERIREDVATNRGLSDEDFDQVIAQGLTLSPQQLVDAGIVDRLTRMSSMGEVLRDIERRPQRRVNPSSLAEYSAPEDDQWGPRQRIAVIYASGATDTDRGMRGRAVASTLRAARNDPGVRAVVLRVDSPGGGILAAEMVADEVRRTNQVKPVIVSMGSFAASGGYWISAFGDTLLATPMTTTGSIGVISARLWDDGFSERLHLNAESVSRGPSADAQFGVTLPLLGLTLPNRPYTDEEREAAVNRLNEQYNLFIRRVSSGRGMSSDNVRAVARGRIYTGEQAQDVGLVDDMGNLQQAIRLAISKAGLSPDDKIDIVQGPGLEITSVMDLLELVDTEEMALYPFTVEYQLEQYLEHVLEHRGQPQAMLPHQFLNWTTPDY